jgi:predicted enzyme related to lactoylglutathione lyase
MIHILDSFSGFSVSDLEKAKEFYGTTLGLTVSEQPGMGINIKLPNNRDVLIYEKKDHSPATYTILNFVVENIDTAVDELVNAGVQIEKYEMTHQDEKGIARGRSVNMGPDIAWFKDPSGNILAVLQ